MKKWVWVLAIIVVALGVGGYSYSRQQLQERAYAADIQAGKQALKSEQYTQAESAFTRATRTKASDVAAQRYLTQTQTYVNGTQALKSHQFSEAQASFTTVKNTKKGSGVLGDRAKTSVKLVKKIISKRKDYTDKYQKALSLNRANEFTDSNGVLAVLFQSKSFHGTYYNDIYKKAKALRKENNAALKSLTGSTPITDNPTESATTSANQTSESQSAPATQPNDSQQKSQRADDKQTATTQSDQTTTQSATSGANSATNNSTPAASSSATTSSITNSAGIQATREEFNEAGLNGNRYTDAEIQAIMQKAAAEHTSPVQAAQHLAQQP
ncbi:cell surface protein [Lactiplantibacillus sp. WILCCON 0030]|uniref:Cell surface protein n=1 Tax=Lactiplantibacillus brownii TaxID=3069269 RepID=A0ABU1ADL5_9LACO|nr:cell surface protein [Lactiplantibacillus brownii]MDQ7938405.1 cell surface protein [Lactiplantibacillus brownii]